MYPLLARLSAETYSNNNMERVLEQDAFEAIRLKKHFDSDYNIPQSQSVTSRMGLERSSTDQFRSDINMLQSEVPAQQRACKDIESFGPLKWWNRVQLPTNESWNS